MERKFGGSSVEFCMGFAGLIVLVTDGVVVASVVVRAAVLISGVICYWVFRYPG